MVGYKFHIEKVCPMLYIAVCGDGLTYNPTKSWGPLNSVNMRFT